MPRGHVRGFEAIPHHNLREPAALLRAVAVAVNLEPIEFGVRPGAGGHARTAGSLTLKSKRVF